MKRSIVGRFLESSQNDPKSIGIMSRALVSPKPPRVCGTTNAVYGTTNAVAGVGIVMKRGDSKRLIEKAINSPIRPFISRKSYELTENNVNNIFKVLIHQFKQIIN